MKNALLVDTIKTFCKYAGSKININKTKCTLIGDLKNKFENIFEISYKESYPIFRYYRTR